MDVAYPKILIIGDSHTLALKAGIKHLREANEIPPSINIEARSIGPEHAFARAFFSASEKCVEITDSACRHEVSVLPLENPNVLYGLIANFSIGRVTSWRVVGHFSPASLAEAEESLSEAVMEQLFHDDQKHLLAFVDALHASGARLFAIESPPKVASHDMFSKSFVGFPKVRREVVAYIDRGYRCYVRKELAARGVPVVAVFPGCVDVDGLLRQEFKSEVIDDFAHGNTLFGAQMIREVIHQLPRLLTGEPGRRER